MKISIFFLCLVYGTATLAIKNVKLTHANVKPTEANLCRLLVDKQSKRDLWHAAYIQRRHVIRITIWFKNADDFWHLPIQWVWVNGKGISLLGLDFRFEAFSLGTVSPSVGSKTIIVHEKPARCLQSWSFHHVRDYIALILLKFNEKMKKSATIPYQFICYHHKQSTQTTTNHSISDTNPVFDYNLKDANYSSKTEYQYQCTMMPSPTDLIESIIPRMRDLKNTNSSEFSLVWWPVRSSDGIVYKVVHVLSSILFLYSLLLVKYFSGPKHELELRRQKQSISFPAENTDVKEQNSANGGKNTTASSSGQLEDTSNRDAYMDRGSGAQENSDFPFSADHTDPLTTAHICSDDNTNMTSSSAGIPCAAFNGYRSLISDDSEQPDITRMNNQDKPEPCLLPMTSGAFSTNNPEQMLQSGLCRYPEDRITLDSNTPLRLTNLVYYIFLRSAPNWAVRFRRFIICILAPFYLYIMLIIDTQFYYYKVSEGVKSEDSSISTFEYLFMKDIHSASTRLYIFCMGSYVIGTLILTFWAPINLGERLMYKDDNHFLRRPLPVELHMPPTEAQGYKLLYKSLIHRTCLVIEPKFWKFFFGELIWNFKGTLTDAFPNLQNEGMVDCLKLCMYPVWVLWLFFSFPVLLTPVGAFFSHIALWWLNDFIHQSTTSFNDNGDSESEEARQCSRFVRIVILVVGLIWIAVTLTVFIMIPTVTMLAKVFDCTVIGLLVNYKIVLPRFILVLAAAFYICKFYFQLPNNYLILKKILFEEAEKQNTKDVSGTPLVTQDKIGQPWLPEDLYEKMCIRLQPISQSEFRTIAQIILTTVFIFFIVYNIEYFSLLEDSDLGQALVTLLIVQSPRLLNLLPGGALESIEQCRLRYIVHFEVKQYVNCYAKLHPNCPDE